MLTIQIEKLTNFVKNSCAQWRNTSQCMRNSKRQWKKLTCLKRFSLSLQQKRDYMKYSVIFKQASNRSHRIYLLNKDSRSWQNWLTKWTTTHWNIRRKIEISSKKLLNNRRNRTTETIRVSIIKSIREKKCFVNFQHARRLRARLCWQSNHLIKC